MLTKEHLEVSENLNRLIRKEMNVLADHISVTGCKDWDDYLKMTGQIAGLARAEGYLKDILRQLSGTEDNDS